MSHLGNRIYFFRKRAGLSQMKLELESGVALGGLSRIENGEINPNKETIRNIAEALSLTPREYNYLVGSFSRPASTEEREKAVKELENTFEDERIYAYLFDETQTLLYFSKGIQKLILRVVQKDYPQLRLEDYIGKTLYEVLLTPSFGIYSMLSQDQNDFLELLKSLLIRFYIETSFMFDNPQVQKTLEIVKSHPIASQAWKEVLAEKPSIYNNESTTFYMHFGPFKAKMEYKIEKMLSNDRFEVIIYKPKNIFLKIINMFG